MLLNRKGQSMVSQISGVAAPLVIHEPDVLLLSYFLADQDPQQASQEFINHPWIKSWIPNIQIQGVTQRLQQMQQAGLFAESQAPNEGLTLQPLAQVAVDELTLPDELSLSSNSAISFHRDGFFACTPDGIPCVLPTSWVILMLAFADGKDWRQVVEEKQFMFDEAPEDILKTLFHHKLLIQRKSSGQAQTD